MPMLCQKDRQNEYSNESNFTPFWSTTLGLNAKSVLPQLSESPNNFDLKFRKFTDTRNIVRFKAIPPFLKSTFSHRTHPTVRVLF